MTTMAVAAVLGGFWPTNGVTTLSSMSGEGRGRREIAMGFARRSQRDKRAVAVALLGVAPGAAATASYTRIANSTELGGVRTIETVITLNRPTTVGDVTELTQDYFSYTSRTHTINQQTNLDGGPITGLPIKPLALGFRSPGAGGVKAIEPDGVPTLEQFRASLGEESPPEQPAPPARKPRNRKPR